MVRCWLFMRYFQFKCKERSHCIRRRIRPRMYYVCRLMHTNNKIATEDDAFDVVLASSSFTSLANFLVVEIDKLDPDASGFTACCVVEMTWVNMPDSYKNFG